MRSIPPKKPSEIALDVADAVAFESGRPWRVEDLRKKALEACRTAMQHAARAGLSRVQVYGRMRRSIYQQVLKASREMDALPPGQRKPTPEQIEMALESFSAEQWMTLIDGLDQTGVQALLSHIRQDTGELKQRHRERKIGRIEGRAIMRDTDLWLRENRSKVVPISDVYWSLLWPELARQANREGKGHPATGRSVAELSSNRSIARHLSKRDEQTGCEMKVSR
jgi:hypothetical protein